MVNMDEKSRKNIEEMEKHSRFPTGVGRIDRGECPIDGLTPMNCMFCDFGHMLECHYPHTCKEAECSHYLQGQDTETYEEDPI